MKWLLQSKKMLRILGLKRISILRDRKDKIKVSLFKASFNKDNLFIKVQIKQNKDYLSQKSLKNTQNKSLKYNQNKSKDKVSFKFKTKII